MARVHGAEMKRRSSHELSGLGRSRPMECRRTFGKQAKDPGMTGTVRIAHPAEAELVLAAL